MKCLLSWVTAGLAALLQLHCLAGALSLERNQPDARVVKELRVAAKDQQRINLENQLDARTEDLTQQKNIAHLKKLGDAAKDQQRINLENNLENQLDARTEELTQQKNIAHGLELEVRELQSDLQAEKKALASESQKEQALQQKLNRVRVALDDAPTGKRSDESGGKGSSTSAADPSAVPAVSTMLAPAAATHELSPQAPPALQKPTQVVQSQQTTAQELLPSEAAPVESPSESRSSPATPAANLMTDLDSAMNAFAEKPAEGHNEKAVEGVHNMAAKTKHAPKATSPQSAQKPPKAKHSPRGPSLRGAEPISKVIATPAIVKAMPTLPAVSTLPPSPPEVSSEDNAVASVKESDLGEATTDFDALEAQLHDEDRRIQDSDGEDAPKAASPPSAPQPSKVKHSPQAPSLRGAEPIRNAIATSAIAKIVPALQVLSDANTEASAVKDSGAAPVKDSGAAPAPTSDFDELEEQLHDEDRRIQDLDSENALDAMTEGGLPAAPGSSQPTANKAAATVQPKMELDSEAPVEDLNAEAPGPDVSEASTAMA